MRHAKRKLINVYQGAFRVPRPDGTEGRTLLLGRFRGGSQYYGLLGLALARGLVSVVVCGCVQGKEVCDTMTVEEAARFGGHLK